MRYLCFCNFDSFNPRAHVERDACPPCCSQLHRCFNPRAHVERDSVTVKIPKMGCVSIHAPTWSATFANSSACSNESFQSTRPRGARPLPLRRLCQLTCFNPRAHVERDGDKRKELRRKMFQSTRPRGARRRELPLTFTSQRFQSTRPRGARQTRDIG